MISLCYATAIVWLPRVPLFVLLEADMEVEAEASGMSGIMEILAGLMVTDLVQLYVL